MDAQLITASQARKRSEKNAPDARQARIDSKLNIIDNAIKIATEHASFEISYVFVDHELELMPEIVDSLTARGFRVEEVLHKNQLGAKIKIYW